MGTEVSDLPLAVDMDGTLILSDMSRISIRRVLFRKPWLIPSVIFKEMTGKRAGWKRDLGRILVFNPSELDYHEGFLEWLTGCLLYTSPSPRDDELSRMPSSA